MSLANILQLSGGALNAQTVRLNTIASNLANVDVTAASAEEAYRAKRPVFATLLDDARNRTEGSFGVEVSGMTESDRPNPVVYDPGNPKADQDGYVYKSNVNPLEELTDMLDAARSFEAVVNVANTARELMMRTIDMNTK